jgi:putative redox protein
VREVSLRWDQAGPLRFEAYGPNGHRVQLDSSVEGGGEGDGFSPKSLLLIALGGCTGMDVLSILRKMRQDVTAYSVEVRGWEHDQHPKKFDHVIIEHVVEGHQLNQEMVDRAIKLSHEKYCGVSASLAGSVEIEVASRLVEAP